MSGSPKINSIVLKMAAWGARILPRGVKSAIYHWEPLARLVRSQLNRAVPQGLSEVSVAAGELAGTRLLLDLKTEKDYWLGTYEPELQVALRTLVQPGMTAYDLGANIGYISLILAKRVTPGGFVFAFEALPENVTRLQKNIEFSGLRGKIISPILDQDELKKAKDFTSTINGKDETAHIIVIPAAVVDHSGSVSFLVGPSGGMGKAVGSAGRQEVSYDQVIEMPGISLDEFVFSQGNPPPQVIKMDIEGGEVLALPGMRHLLDEYHPLILMELHGPEAAQVAWDLLSAAGYRICRMEPGFPVVEFMEALDWKAYLVAF